VNAEILRLSSSDSLRMTTEKKRKRKKEEEGHDVSCPYKRK
jgi:hypothetical protein